MDWVGLLSKVPDVGDVRPMAPDRVRLTVRRRPVTVRIHRTQRVPRPNELARIERVTGAPALFVAPHLTAAARTALEAAGWWWADDDAAAVRIWQTWHRVSATPDLSSSGWLDRRTSPADSVSAARAGRSDLAIVRLLLGEPTGRWTQVALAERIGVSQPAVSKALVRLRARGLVDDASRLTNHAEALDWWLVRYRGPSGLATHWHSLGDAWATTRAVLDVAPDEAVISGAVAADVLAPWLPPDRVVVYAPAGLAASPARMAQVTEPEDATATVIVTADKELFWSAEGARATAPDGTAVTLADPLQILWDLATAPTDDPSRRDEAADRLVAWILDRAAGT